MGFTLNEDAESLLQQSTESNTNEYKIKNIRDGFRYNSTYLQTKHDKILKKVKSYLKKI